MRGRGRLAALAAAALALAAPAGQSVAATVPAQGSIEVLFTPWDDAEGALIRTIGEARQSIHVQAFIFSSRNIARALERAKKRGIEVEMLADREQALNSERSLLPQLHAAGIPIRLETRYASAHNKVMIIDAGLASPVVVTGSYNFTFSAQARNAENLLIIRDSPSLARLYMENWVRHRQEAEPYSR